LNRGYLYILDMEGQLLPATRTLAGVQLDDLLGRFKLNTFIEKVPTPFAEYALRHPNQPKNINLQLKVAF